VNTRRYPIPTWALVLVAIAGVAGLILTDPVASVGATLEEFPPPLPLDPLPEAPAAAWLAWAIPAGSFAILALGLLLAAVDLTDAGESRLLRRLNVPLESLRVYRTRRALERALERAYEATDRDERIARLRAAGCPVYICPDCNGFTYSSAVNATMDNVIAMHLHLNRSCSGGASRA
jgi:pimeloyl-ACP methyl ester carboxylesterase